MCGRKSPEIVFHTRCSIVKLSQAGNSQRKRIKDLSISHTIVLSIIKKVPKYWFCMKHEIKKQKTAADNTGDKSSITPREIEKEKDIAQS